MAAKITCMILLLSQDHNIFDTIRTGGRWIPFLFNCPEKVKYSILATMHYATIQICYFFSVLRVLSLKKALKFQEKKIFSLHGLMGIPKIKTKLNYFG